MIPTLGARVRSGLCTGGALALALQATPLLAQQAEPDPETEQSADGAGLEAGSIVVPPPANADLPEVETIISDEEFNASTPAFADDALDLSTELESIEEFERRFAAEQGIDVAAPSSPASSSPVVSSPIVSRLPELADGDAVEEIGDAPIRDAELLQPLSPLAEFEVRDVEYEDASTGDDAPSLTYEVVIAGLEAADDVTAFDLRGEFDRLSVLDDGDGEAANGAMLRARLEEDKAVLLRLLRAEGFYSATVAARIQRPESDSEQTFSALLTVDPGGRYTFADIIIDAGPVVPVDLISSNVALKIGEPIVAARVQGAEARIAVTLPMQGYPFAEVGQRDILLDPETVDGVYTLPIETGPRSRFGGFTTAGNLAFAAEHIEVLARFERGDLYDSRMVDDLRQALIATGLFSAISVVPQPTGEAAEDGTEYVTIAVEQEAGPPRTIAGSAGFGTGEGFTLEGSWSHRNLFPPEGALIASAALGTLEQGAGLTFRRANAGRRDRTFEIGLSARRANYDAFEALTGRLGVLVSYLSTPLWQKKFTYAFGGEILGTVEDDFDFDLGDTVERTYFIGALTGQLGFDTSDDLLNPTEGFRLGALLQPEGSLQDGFNPYVRAILDGSAYYPVGDSFVIAGRMRVGTIAGVSRTDIAPSRRLYAGGGGSVRGFGFQQLGPKVDEPNPNFDATDPEETADEFIVRPVGGRSVAEAAVELRYRFGDYGVVAFVDAGQVYESSTPGFSDIRYGVGIGGRFYTNFGPLRLDIATPLGRRDGESAINVYVSIGQAF